MMEGATEYRDTWRGLRILVPAGWQAKRSGLGIFLHDEAGRQTVIVQPRPGAGSIERLEQDLEAWLKRLDPEAELRAEPGAASPARFCAVTARTGGGEAVSGAFALQPGERAGLITGYLAPRDGNSSAAIRALQSLSALPALARRAWREPAEGACTALVPEGWQAEGAIRRTKGLPAIEFRAHSGEGMGALAGAEGKLYMEPGLLGGILGGISGGLVSQARFVDAAAYAEAHLLPALRKEAPSTRIEAVIPRPDLIPTGVAQEAASSGVGVKEVLQGRPSAADVLLSFERNGRRMQRVSRVLTMRVPAPLAHGLPLWMALTPLAYDAPQGSLAEWEPVLEGVCLSFQIDSSWRERQQAQMAAQVGLRVPQARPAAEGSALLGEAEREFSAERRRHLAIHERPFPTPPEEPEGAVELAELCEVGVWQERPEERCFADA